MSFYNIAFKLWNCVVGKKSLLSRYISSYSTIYSQMGVSNMPKNRNLSYYFFIHISTIYKIWTKCIIKRLSTSMMISKLLRKLFILFNFSGYIKIFKTNTKINKLYSKGYLVNRKVVTQEKNNNIWKSDQNIIRNFPRTTRLIFIKAQ